MLFSPYLKSSSKIFPTTLPRLDFLTKKLINPGPAISIFSTASSSSILLIISSAITLGFLRKTLVNCIATFEEKSPLSVFFGVST